MPKANIHPTYYPNAKVICSCGATFEMGATREEMRVDLCRSCHPYYTGTQKLIDTAGRVDRFREKMAQAQARQAVNQPKQEAQAEETVTEAEGQSEEAGKEE